MIPLNNDFAPAEDGVTVFFISSPVHVELLLPIRTDAIDFTPEVTHQDPDGRNKNSEAIKALKTQAADALKARNEKGE